MNTGMIYVVVACVSLFQLLLIYNRTVKTQYKETIDRNFCRLILFFAAFSLVDAFWGICSAGVWFVDSFLFNLATYAYHTICGFSAFVWYGYVMKYLGIEGRNRSRFNAFRTILIVCQMAMILLNIFNHEGFFVTTDLNYHMGSMRAYMYLAQFLYYIVIVGYSGIKLFFTNCPNAYLIKNAFVFSLVPLLFGIGQYLFYDVAMYSMGFMLSAFIIYAYNLTDMREKHLAGLADESNRFAMVDILTDLNNRRAYEEDLKKYVQEPEDNKLVYVSMDINGLKTVNDTQGHEAGDELIVGAANCIKMCFGSYGKIYRMGGDEFVALIQADATQLERIQKDFTNTCNHWRGKLVQELHISCGYVTRQDNVNATIYEMAIMADKRMYQDKALYYTNHGIGRRT